MPPNLHPRSRLTSSLFATTLLASFLVVGIPHLIPCPTPRVAYADEPTNPDGTRRRRRRRRRCAQDADPATMTTGQQQHAASTSTEGPKSSTFDVFADNEEDDFVDEDRSEGGRKPRRVRRECPVPKPGGIIGETLGFKSTRGRDRKTVPDSEQPP